MALKTRQRKVFAGQFYWGGTLLNCNAGAQRLAFRRWKWRFKAQRFKPAWLRGRCSEQVRK